MLKNKKNRGGHYFSSSISGSSLCFFFFFFSFSQGLAPVVDGSSWQPPRESACLILFGNNLVSPVLKTSPEASVQSCVGTQDMFRFSLFL